MIIQDTSYLEHFGIPKKSGRYPWGSGEDDYTNNIDFLGYVSRLKKEGMSELEIARGLEVSTKVLRDTKIIAKEEVKQERLREIHKLRDKNVSYVAIGKKLGMPESTVRALCKQRESVKINVLEVTAQMLRDEIADKRFIDVGSGVENRLGITYNKLSTAVSKLKDEGYKPYYHKIPTTIGNFTTMKILGAKDSTFPELLDNLDMVQQIGAYTSDGGSNYKKPLPPLVFDSKRLAIRYGKDGGNEADGVIYVRPNTPDVTIGDSSHYAQVRIAVDGTHYIKGMAMYKNDLPPGVDLMFNTPKKDTGNKLDALKPIKDDPENPFGSNINRQITAKDSNGKEYLTSVMNKVNEEGDWETWSRNLSSQFLSKQSPSLAKTQLAMTYENKKADLDEILSLTNPAVRVKLLKSFSDGADSSARHLEAASLPRQGTHHVILPLPSSAIKENEIYAPNFIPGERVVLIRHPHAGVFEIPELIVNNSNPTAKAILGQAKDAVGINYKVAQHLSGADFDGDTVMVIPNNEGRIKTAPLLKRLKDFNAIEAFPYYEGMHIMTKQEKGSEMGKISNLITDMNIQNAGADEMARAVRHSMVVIDAVKHELNYKLSAQEHNISQLKTKYQGGPTSGASTLISKANARADVPRRKPRAAKDGGPIDKATGKLMYTPTGESFVKYKMRTDPTTGKKVPIEGTGKVVFPTVRSKKMNEVDNAHDLSSGTLMEKIYADHANKLKALANAGRKEMVLTKPIPQSPSAKAAYANEVTSLKAKLNVAMMNRPLERQAQLIASITSSAKIASNPDLDGDEIKKIRSQELIKARIRTGAKKNDIYFEDNEWAAIQAGAISNHQLTEMLKKADLDRVKELATPRTTILMTSTKQRRAEGMLKSGYTEAEVAHALGVSLSTLKNSLKA